MISLYECLKKDEIRKDKTMMEQVNRELDEGNKFLKLARRDKTELAIFGAYSAIFHYARALLYAKGYSERSHRCLFSAISELFPELEAEIETANKIRVLRHSFSYSGREIKKEDIGFIIEFATKFEKSIKGALGV